MFKQVFVIMFILVTASTFAQVINTGGGGPDGKDESVKKEDEFNAFVKEKMVQDINKENKELMEEINISWSECYTTKMNAKDLVDLYSQLVILSTGNGPKVRKEYLKEYGENCEKTKVFECFLKKQEIRNHIYALVTRKSYHDYLESKGIDKLKSRQQLIKYYLDLLKVPSFE